MNHYTCRSAAYSLFRNLTQRQRCHDAKNEYGCHLFFTKSSDLNPKSRLTSFLLTLFFGPLGLFYSSLAGAIALLVIGLMNAELLLSEKGFFGMAFTLSLFAAVTVQKNVRDSQKPQEDEAPPLFKEEVAAPHKLHIAKGASD